MLDAPHAGLKVPQSEIAVQSINMQADAKPIQSILAGTGKLSAETMTASPSLPMLHDPDEGPLLAARCSRIPCYRIVRMPDCRDAARVILPIAWMQIVTRARIGLIEICLEWSTIPAWRRLPEVRQ